MDFFSCAKTIKLIFLAEKNTKINSQKIIAFY